MSETLTELGTAIAGARRSVFRLEARQHYADDPQWLAYLDGRDWRSNDDLLAWCELVRSVSARGVPMQRVHVITEPWTAYVHFEVEQHYPYNLAAGEDVRLVHAAESWTVSDFWMIDDHAWVMTYGADGALSAVTPATDRALTSLRQWRADALAASVPAGATAP